MQVYSTCHPSGSYSQIDDDLGHIYDTPALHADMIAVRENTTATNSMAVENNGSATNNMAAAVCVESLPAVAESSNEDTGSVSYDMPPQGQEDIGAHVVGDIACVEHSSDEE